MRSRIWLVILGFVLVVAAVVMLVNLFSGNHSPTSDSVPTLVASTHPPASTEEAMITPTVSLSVSPTSPGPLLYTVQEGDTLGAIAQAYDVSVEDLVAANDLANPDMLGVGQSLIIPVEPMATSTISLAPSAVVDAPPEPSPTEVPSPAGTSSPAALPTLTPSAPPLIEIGQVLGSGDLAVERVVVRNRGGRGDLEGWTLSDAAGNTFTFPALTLFAGADVYIHSAEGVSSPTDLYWNRVNPAWDGGELITLRDAAGDVVDTYVVP